MNILRYIGHVSLTVRGKTGLIWDRLEKMGPVVHVLSGQRVQQESASGCHSLTKNEMTPLFYISYYTFGTAAFLR